MHDDRVVGGATLDLIKPLDGYRVRGVGAEPVDRLGREGDDVALADEGGGFVGRVGEDGVHGFRGPVRGGRGRGAKVRRAGRGGTPPPQGGGEIRASFGEVEDPGSYSRSIRRRMSS